jgi:arylsulfatase A-like enzyme
MQVNLLAPIFESDKIMPTSVYRQLTVTLLVCLCVLGGRIQADAPNVLFLLSDDHSYPYVGCYGDKNVTTPNLDRLAQRGVAFHRFFTSAPQCVLSRAALMTGRSPVAARMIRFSSPLPADEVALPELLRDRANYFTGICGRGFHLDGSANVPAAIERVFREHAMRTFEQRVDYLRSGTDVEVVSRVAEFLDLRPADRPFFMWANFSDPHHIWNADASFRPAPISLSLPGHLPDLPGVREQLADYCAEINRLDQRVGSVLELLRSRGLLESTMIVFAGDNGAALPHGKGSLYDPGSNCPFLVAWPGHCIEGSHSSALISGEDLTPSILEAAGIEIPANMTGKSFLPLLNGNHDEQREYVFVARGPHGSAPVRVEASNAPYDMARAVRNQRYKFIYNCTPWLPYGPVDSAGGDCWRQMVAADAAGELSPELHRAYFVSPRPVYELYDLESDPSELTNLSGREELREVERQLRTALAEKMVLEFDHLPLPDLLE